MADKLYKIQIKRTGTPIELYIKSLIQTFSSENTKRNLEAIKRTVLKDTNDFINSSRQRKGEIHDEAWRTTKRNNLYNAIAEGTYIQSKGNRHLLVIGEQKYLKKHAPYWRIVNFGGRINMKGKQLYGWFDRGYAPSSDLRGGDQIFKQGYRHSYPIHGGYGYPMKPTIIPPMYYLNRMAQVFEIEILLLEEYYKRQLKYAAERRATLNALPVV